MIIAQNNHTNSLYAAQAKNSQLMRDSSLRLGTSDKLSHASSSGGMLALSTKLRFEIRGNQALQTSLSDALGYATLQEEQLKAAQDIVVRLAEMAAQASDVNKTAAERNAINGEFTVLADEIATLQGDLDYKGNNLFETALTFRTTMNGSNGNTLSLNSLKFSLWLSTILIQSVTTANLGTTVLASLHTKLASLAALQAQSSVHVNRVTRALDLGKALNNQYAEVESHIRNTDLAEESGTFIKYQVMSSAADSMVAQANLSVRNILKFFTS